MPGKWSACLILALVVMAATGCATRRYNLVARDVAYLEPRETLADVYVLQTDGSIQHFRRVEIADDALRGTTVDGERLSIETADIERAWRAGSAPTRGFEWIVRGLAVCGALAVAVVMAMPPMNWE